MGMAKAVSLKSVNKKLKRAWKRVKPEKLVKGFLNCEICNSLDGTQDYMLWNDESDVSNNGSASCDYNSVMGGGGGGSVVVVVAVVAMRVVIIITD